jgi:protoheme IX farnesyltransferase
MLPVVAGKAATKRQILIYSALLVPASALPWALGFAGAVYGATALVCGAILVALAFRLRRSSEADRRASHRLFLFSITYLFVLFAALLIDHGGSTWRHKVLAPNAGVVHDDTLSAAVQLDRESIRVMTGEV